MKAPKMDLGTWRGIAELVVGVVILHAVFLGLLLLVLRAA